MDMIISNLKKLLSICLNDAGQACRLMNYEYLQDRHIDDETAAKRAIERLNNDRKREELS